MTIDFNKNPDGLVPAIIQDAKTKNVLMLGFMNQDALDKTQNTKKVTFFSRTKKRSWTKGEESGNFLFVKEILIDFKTKESPKNMGEVMKFLKTNFDGQYPAKSPVGMFKDLYILNDLGVVGKAIHDYNEGV